MNLSDPLPAQLFLAGEASELAAFAELADHARWTCTRLHSPGEILARIRRGDHADAVIIAPGNRVRDYLEMCRALKLQSRTSFVPVVFLLPAESADHRVQVYQSGANDCIPLPASPDELTLRVLKAIRAGHATDSLEDATAVITALANAIEGKDSYTCGHVERVAMYSLEIGKAIGVQPGELATLRTGALLHDIGKVTVPDQVLNKPGQLTVEEMEVIKRHPLVGDEILKTMRTFQAIRPIVRWHHERPNGKGYPDGVGGDDLPLLPRIVAVADCFDALISDRPYRAALPLPRCQAILESAAEQDDLDGTLVQVLMSLTGQSAVNQPVPVIN